MADGNPESIPPYLLFNEDLRWDAPVLQQHNQLPVEVAGNVLCVAANLERKDRRNDSLARLKKDSDIGTINPCPTPQFRNVRFRKTKGCNEHAHQSRYLNIQVGTFELLHARAYKDVERSVRERWDRADCRGSVE